MERPAGLTPDEIQADCDFSHCTIIPDDPILCLAGMYMSDTDPRKVNLGIGAYRDNEGKPYVFPIIKKVEHEIVSDILLNKEYAPVEGLSEFYNGARQVLFGWDHPEVNSGKIASC